MSNYDIKFVKEMEQLSYHVTDTKKYEKPQGWQEMKTYMNNKNGFYAVSYVNNDKKVLAFAGTQPLLGLNEVRKDIGADLKLAIDKLPAQAEDAFQAYQSFIKTYGSDNVYVIGYSLAGSLGQIVCNETGANCITFEAYGVGDIVTPKYTDNIINFGNENDPIFLKNIDGQLGNTYIIPNNRVERSNDYAYNVEKIFSRDNIHNINILKHMPNNIGDIADAIEYTGRPFKLYASYDNYDDNLFDITNKVFYGDSPVLLNQRTSNEAEQIIKQYYENGDKLPKKSELDKRVRLGELIYVENYVRSDGTKVSGYYRAYPKK